MSKNFALNIRYSRLNESFEKYFSEVMEQIGHLLICKTANSKTKNFKNVFGELTSNKQTLIFFVYKIKLKMNIKFGYRMLYEHQGVTLNEHVEVNLFEFII